MADRLIFMAARRCGKIIAPDGFLPDGLVFSGHAIALPIVKDLRELSHRLEGSVLIKFSSLMKRGPESHRALPALSLRFSGAAAPHPMPSAGDQDLVFAPWSSWWGACLAPHQVDLEDYLGNFYFPLLPIEDAGIGRTELRVCIHREKTTLAPQTPQTPRTAEKRASPGEGTAARIEENRIARLRTEILDSGTTLDLELRGSDLGFETWVPFLELRDFRPVPWRAESLQFDPFQGDRGLRPAGPWNKLRLLRRIPSLAIAPPPDGTPSDGGAETDPNLERAEEAA